MTRGSKTRKRYRASRYVISLLLTAAMLLTMMGSGFMHVFAATGDAIDYPQYLMSVMACAEETVNEDGKTTNVLDGSISTIWHTPWSNHGLHGVNEGTGTSYTGIDSANCHWIKLDLGSEQSVLGVRYQPRQNQTNGNFTSVRVYYSLDGTSYTQVGTGVTSWANNGTEKTFSFPSAVTARHILIFAPTTSGNYGSCAELNVIVADQANAESWEYAQEAIAKLNDVVNLPGLVSYSEIDLQEAIAAVKAASSNPLDVAKPIIDTIVAEFYETVKAYVYDPSLTPPSVSAPGGFYDQNFLLEITGAGEGDTIHYTIDGSEPTAASPVYEGPITIKPRDINDAPMTQAYANRYGEANNMRSVYNAMVVKACVITKNGRMSDATTNSYFVGEDFEKMFGMPVLSASLPPDDFGGPQGMYTDWRSESHTGKGFVEYFDTDGTSEFRRFCEMKIGGHGSRGDRKKTIQFNFTKNNPSSAGSYLDYDVYSDNTANYYDSSKISTFAKLRVRTTDWTGTTVRETLTAAISDPLRIDTMNNRHVAVFINGEFWGVYPLREQLDNNWVSIHYGIPKKQVVQLAFDWDTANSGYSSTEPLYRVEYSEGPDGGEETYYGSYMDMYNSIVKQDLTVAENYEKVKTHVDIDNLIDYFIVYYFTDNDDWPGNNVKMWRTVDVNENIYGHDGLWRFAVHDFDISFESVTRDRMTSFTTPKSQTDPRQPYWAVEMWRKLFTSTEFRETFAARYATYLGTAFSPEVTFAKLDEIVADASPGIDKDFYRWNYNGGKLGDLTSWLNWQIGTDASSGLRYYLANRGSASLGHIRNYYNNNFSLGASSSYTKVSYINDPVKGYLDVSGAEIRPLIYGDELASSFSANYIKNLPVTVTAKPLDGYEFDHFELTKAGGEVEIITANPLTYTPSSEATATLKAVYEELPEPPEPEYILTAEKLDGKIAAKFENGFDDAKDVNLILAVYSEDGVLDIAKSHSVTVEGKSAYETDFQFDISEYPDTCYFKVFAWDSAFAPICDAIKIV